MDEWCLLVFAAPKRPFCPFATKTVRGLNLHRTPSAMHILACWSVFKYNVHAFRR